MKRYALLLLLLPALLLAAGCGGKKSSTTAAAPSTVPPTSTGATGGKMNKHGTMNVSGMSSVSVTQHDYYFSPTVLHGKSGQKLTVKLTNKGTVEHNFSITSEHISQNVQPGKTATVSVTFPSSGAVEFFCMFHVSLGMAGELQIGNASAPMSTTTTPTKTTTSSGYGY